MTHLGLLKGRKGGGIEEISYNTTKGQWASRTYFSMRHVFRSLVDVPCSCTQMANLEDAVDDDSVMYISSAPPRPAAKPAKQHPAARSGTSIRHVLT